MFRSLVLAASLLMAAVAAAQTAATPAQSPSPSPTPVKADPAAVPAGDDVIMLVGACQAKPGETVPPGCIGGVTKADFERMQQLISLPEAQQRQFANRLASLIAASNEAKRRGLENTPETQEWERIFKMQALATALQSQIRKQAAEVPESEIQSYYTQHEKEFRGGKFEKVTIPKKPGTKEQPANPEADKAFATKIRERWVAGEDPEKLQKEASERANPKGTPPNIHLPAVGDQPVRALPPTDQAVFDLAPGSFSELMSNANGFYVYKVISSATSKLEDKYRGETTVHDFIKRILQQQRMQQAMQGLQSSTVIKLNEKYFGPETPAGFPGMPGARPGGGPPNVQMTPAPPRPASKPPVAPPAGASKGTQAAK